MSKKSTSPKKWTTAEEQYVVKNMNKLSITEMAKELKRPYGGVAWKKGELRKQNHLVKPLPKKTLGKFQDSPTVRSSYRPPQKSFWDKVKEFFS